jgi:hypothetical protein
MKDKTKVLIWFSMLCVFMISICIVFYFVEKQKMEHIELPKSSAESSYIKQAELALLPKLHPNGFTEYEIISKIRGVSEDILHGYVQTESQGYQYAIGDGGKSEGFCQINSDYRDIWVKLCGYEYDPFDLFDSLNLCALIYKQNCSIFPENHRKAICAYCRGAGGVEKYGVIDWYVDSVLRYCKNT